MLFSAARIDPGMDITDPVGLVDSGSSCCRFLDNGLGLGSLILVGVARSVDGEEGVDRLLARPKMSLAADATVQLDAPPAPMIIPSAPPPLALNTPELLFRMMPESEMRPGPPIPAAAPANRVDTSDAILDDRSAEPRA